MAAAGPPPEKRMRYNLRSVNQSSAPEEQAEPSRYMLRSKTNLDSVTYDSIELPRKRKVPFQRRNQRNLGKNLTDLNSDCLLKIIEYLNPMDLCNVAQTSKRFRDLAQYHFYRKHRNFSCFSILNDGIIHLDMFKRLLRVFGHHIRSLAIPQYVFVNEEGIAAELLEVIARYCRESLKLLWMDGFVMNSNLIKLMKPVFNRIEAIEFSNCGIYHNENPMQNVKLMKLIETEMNHQFLASKFPKLIELQLIYLDDTQNATVIDFVKSNPGVEKLSIVECYGVSTAVFEAIGQLKGLRELEFQQHYSRPEEIFRTDLNNLSALTELKVLKLNCAKHSVSQLLETFVTNGVHLEHLELANGPMDTPTFESILKLNSLTALKFNEMADITNSRIYAFAQKLKLLREFAIKSYGNIGLFGFNAMVRDINSLSSLKIDIPDFQMNLETYQGMLNAVQKREERNRLEITIYNNGADENNNEQPVVPNQVINDQNKKWIHVKWLNRTWNRVFPYVASQDDDDDFLDDFMEMDIDLLDPPDYENMM